jgi:hypothetical protein
MVFLSAFKGAGWPAAGSQNQRQLRVRVHRGAGTYSVPTKAKLMLIQILGSRPQSRGSGIHRLNQKFL